MRSSLDKPIKEVFTDSDELLDYLASVRDWHITYGGATTKGWAEAARRAMQFAIDFLESHDEEWAWLEDDREEKG